MTQNLHVLIWQFYPAAEKLGKLTSPPAIFMKYHSFINSREDEWLGGLSRIGCANDERDHIFTLYSPPAPSSTSQLHRSPPYRHDRKMSPRISSLVSSHSSGKPCIKDFTDSAIAIVARLPPTTIKEIKEAIKVALDSGTLEADKDLRSSPERARFVESINTILRDTISVEELNSLYVIHPDLELVRFVFYQLAMRCRASYLGKKKNKPAKKNVRPPRSLMH